MFVRLWGSATAHDVALFMAVASSYGRDPDDPAASIEDVLVDFPHVLPGGVSVVSTERAVMPGCCCGLEHWSEWRHILTTGRSPWTGHDPAPLVELTDKAVQVWSDGGMSEKPAHEIPITFSRASFEDAIGSLAQDLRDFVAPLGAWLNVHAPGASAKFVSAFSARFLV
jgi:hypothetical protein